MEKWVEKDTVLEGSIRKSIFLMVATRIACSAVLLYPDGVEAEVEVGRRLRRQQQRATMMMAREFDTRMVRF